MRRALLVAVVLALVAAAVGVVPGSSAVTSAAAVWGKAVKVPGTAALNVDGSATANVVSCAAAGECAAGGYYKDGSGHVQGFVVSEKKGVWGKAAKVPGMAVLNVGGYANLRALSCAAVGECAAGGYYKDGSGRSQAFVVSETKGVWGAAVEVPGSAALNAGGDADVTAVSCGAVGECSAGGYYMDGSDHFQAFVVREKEGVPGTAFEVPGTAALNAGGAAFVFAVSCAAVNECVVGGDYSDGAHLSQAFVSSETTAKGVWHAATEVPGTAALNVGGDAAVTAVSCAAVGECAAGGTYRDSSGRYQAFVVSEKKGVWGAAVKVPGTPKLNVGGSAGLSDISCAAVGECAAGGYYKDASGNVQAFVVTEAKGVWGAAIEVPGTAALNVDGAASVSAISCGGVGDCAAVGGYEDGADDGQAFVANAAVPCVVPHVVGKTLSAAEGALSSAHCGVGKITKVFSAVSKGHVVSQSPKSGTQLKAGSKVALSVSKGPKS